jgi:hypothetical protein
MCTTGATFAFQPEGELHIWFVLRGCILLGEPIIPMSVPRVSRDVFCNRNLKLICLIFNLYIIKASSLFPAISQYLNINVSKDLLLGFNNKFGYLKYLKQDKEISVSTLPYWNLSVEYIVSIDWCLTPTLAVFQLYCGVNKFYILDTLYT